MEIWRGGWRKLALVWQHVHGSGVPVPAQRHIHRQSPSVQTMETFVVDAPSDRAGRAAVPPSTAARKLRARGPPTVVAGARAVGADGDLVGDRKSGKGVARDLAPYGRALAVAGCPVGDKGPGLEVAAVGPLFDEKQRPVARVEYPPFVAARAVGTLVEGRVEGDGHSHHLGWRQLVQGKPLDQFVSVTLTIDVWCRGVLADR